MQCLGLGMGICEQTAVCVLMHSKQACTNVQVPFQRHVSRAWETAFRCSGADKGPKKLRQGTEVRAATS